MFSRRALLLLAFVIVIFLICPVIDAKLKRSNRQQVSQQLQQKIMEQVRALSAIRFDLD